MQYESNPILNENDMSINKDAWIDEIIDYIRNMEADDDILVYDYGKKGNLKLVIYMDDDTDIRIFVDMWNAPEDPNDGMVYEVDETEFFLKDAFNEIRKELEKIWDKDYVID